jgi:diaminopimelate decarboxylase
MHAPMEEVLQIVGSTCFRSVLAAERAWPAPRGGEAIAIPDAGAYAEVFATQFNAVPRPAAVMISAHGVELVRERESIEDIFRHHRIPEWIRA